MVDRDQVLKDHKEELERGIILLNLDIRHLERQKITARDNDLNDIQEGIRLAKTKIKIYQDRIQLIDDILAGK